MSNKEKFTTKFFSETAFWREVSVNVVSGVLLAFLGFGATQLPWVVNKLKELAVQISTASSDPTFVLPIAERAFKAGDLKKVLSVSNDIMGVDGDPEIQKITSLRNQAWQKLNYSGSDTTYAAAMEKNSKTFKT